VQSFVFSRVRVIYQGTTKAIKGLEHIIGFFCLGKRSLTAVASCLKRDISRVHSGRTGTREFTTGNKKKFFHIKVVQSGDALSKREGL